jgi:hypothetical protein
VAVFDAVFLGVLVKVRVGVWVGAKVAVGVGVQAKAGNPVRALIRLCPVGDPQPVARSYPLTAS